MIVRKINFSDQIRENILTSILKDELQPGEKLSLVKYAHDFQTSVTPVREAFAQLVQAGILQSIPHVGFCVVKIHEREAQEIYELIGIIESNCLLNTYHPHIIKKLIKLSNKLKKCDSTEEKLATDNEFHEVLIDNKRNTVSYSLIKNLKARVFLFELQFMLDRENNISQDEDHDAIINALENGSINVASKLLKTHWKNSAKFIINQIK